MNMHCLVLWQSLGTSFLVVLGAVQENPPKTMNKELSCHKELTI